MCKAFNLSADEFAAQAETLLMGRDFSAKITAAALDDMQQTLVSFDCGELARSV